MGDNFDLEKGGVKFDAGKIRLDLVPPESDLAQAAVYTYGAIKYDDWNWMKGMRRGRLIAALLRHVRAYQMGEEMDPESGLPHTWHMHCCTGMLIGINSREVAIEDRKVAIEAYHSIIDTFEGMNDPKGTKRNEGGTLVLPEPDRQNDYMHILDRVRKSGDVPGYNLEEDGA